MNEPEYCKCSRCRNTHLKSEREWIPQRNSELRDLCCPRCGGKSYYRATPPATPAT